jgi:DNA helicase-2/ATP-dependent DNA helicase PcrA
MKQRFLKICGNDALAVTCGTFHGIYYGILKWACHLNQSNLLLEEEKYRLLRQVCREVENEGKRTSGSPRSGYEGSPGRRYEGSPRSGYERSPGNGYKGSPGSGYERTSGSREEGTQGKRNSDHSESGKEFQGENEHTALKQLAEEIGNVKNNCCEIGEYTSLSYPAEQFRAIYTAYERQKKKLKKIDFEDMLIQCKELFETHPDILAKWQERFQYILVDEFQDVNQAQYDVIRMLAAPEDHLFIVGDDDQSIYGFRGAKPGIMLAFEKDYPQAKRILLDVNYRSDGYIVKSALRVIAKNKTRYEKNIRPSKPSEETVHVQETLDAMDESKYVVEQMQKFRQNGISYAQMAVLYRTASDVRILSEILSEYQIPYTMREQISNIYDHFVGIDISSYFHLSQGNYARKYFMQIINRPNRYIGRDSMREPDVSYETLRKFYCDKHWMAERIDQLEWDMKMIEHQTPYAAIQYIRDKIGYETYLREYAAYRKIDAEELIAVLDEIQECSREYLTIADWFAHVEAYREDLKQNVNLRNQTPTAAGKSPDNKKQSTEEKQITRNAAEKQIAQSSEKKRITQNSGEKPITQNSEEGAVSLLTMHTAKGLEYDSVFIIQGNEGSIPYYKAQMESEIEEERRLFYVAMTRAKRKLIISYTKEKNGKDCSPSRFVNELMNTADAD